MICYEGMIGMPYTLNGIGTSYVGQKNLKTHRGRCEFCNKETNLSSYDTQEYFVILFLPVIPLQKKHIINDCPLCQKHRYMHWKDWQAAKDAHIKEKIAEWQGDSDNPERIFEVLHVIAFYQEQGQFLDFVKKINPAALDSFEMQEYLGDLYEYFGIPEEAVNHYKKALKYEKSQEVQEKLALLLLKQLKPDEARPYLEHILLEKKVESIRLLNLMAESYQALGNHQAASNWLNECKYYFPNLGSDKSYQRLHKISMKHLYGDKKIKPRNLLPPKTVSLNPGLFAWIIIFCIVIGIFSMAFFQEQFKEVYLLNGLERPYTVQINQKKLSIPANGHKSVFIPKGKVIVKVIDADLKIPDQDYVIKTTFKKSLFPNESFFINPDQTALLMWDQTEYVDKSEIKDEKRSELPYKIYHGQSFYVLEKPNYLFEEFPDTVSLDSRKKSEIRSRIIQLKPYEELIRSQFTENEQIAFLQQKLKYQPEDEKSLYLLSEVMPAEAFVSYLKTRLDERPVLVEWHRAYQSTLEILNSQNNLIQEYQDLVKKEPQNHELIYLLARITEDRGEAEQLYYEAIKEPNPSAYALNSLAREMLDSGQYEKAIGLVDRALELLPDKSGIRTTKNILLLATGRYEPLLQGIRELQKVHPLNGYLVAEEVHLLVQKGDSESAKKRIKAYCSEVADSKSRQEWQNYLEAHFAYSCGNPQQYVESMEKVSNHNQHFEIALTANRLKVASQIVEQSYPSRWDYHLLLYIAGSLNQERPIAESHLQKAIKLMKKSYKEQKKVAAALASNRLPDAKSLAKVLMYPSEKRIVMAALSIKFPQQKEVYLEGGRYVNFDTHFPYLFLKRFYQTDNGI